MIRKVKIPEWFWPSVVGVTVVFAVGPSLLVCVACAAVGAVAYWASQNPNRAQEMFDVNVLRYSPAAARARRVRRSINKFIS
eukprot:m51a1_g14859 hypothetical protein (82) ;mRNA; f:923390-923681